MKILRCVMITFLTLLGMTKAYAMTEETYENAIELLVAFADEDARKHAKHFEYSQSAKIIDVEIHAAGNNSTTAKYTDEPLPWAEVNNILRIKTADGYEAISGVDTYDVAGFNDNHLQQLISITPTLLDMQTLDPVEAMALLREKHPELTNEVRASVDIALWDLAARKAGLPLHKMLGSNRDSIKPYASLRFYETLAEYIGAVNEYAGLGYTVFKYHVWGRYEMDSQLVQAVKQQFEGSGYKFMIDFEYAYDLEGALKLAELADEDLFILMEGFIHDSLLDQSAELKRKLPMMVIPAGYDNYTAEFIREGIKKDAWDAARFDVTVVGGLSQALKLMLITEEAGIPVEVQSWGHTLTQIVNLHLMLANDRTNYFEAPMPKHLFEFGMLNGNLLHEGMAKAPNEPGLGIKVDWEKLKTADFYRSPK